MARDVRGVAAAATAQARCGVLVGPKAKNETKCTRLEERAQHNLSCSVSTSLSLSLFLSLCHSHLCVQGAKHQLLYQYLVVTFLKPMQPVFDSQDRCPLP